MGSRNTSIPFRCTRLLILGMLYCYSGVLSQDYYTGAVYEHSRQGGDTPEAVVRANLEYYQRASKVAAEQGADIIVFPEYGIFPAFQNRSDIKPYLEFVPNPKEITVTPCDEANLFADRPIMYSLSCMAKKNQIVVVANMGSVEPCENDIKCPDDGVLHLNTNVVFDKNGTLLARYSKERLYFEFAMDLPREEQDPIFETSFGKFATFICFDMIFEKMAAASRLKDVDAILYSFMGVDTFPFFISTQFGEAWAMGNNATLLTSNIQMPGYFSTGSGIFKGRKGSVGHNHNPDGISKLIVATLPKRNQDILPQTKITAIVKNGTEQVREDGEDVPEVCSYRILGESKDIYHDYRCWNEDVANYTLKKLNGTEGHLQVCNNGMCCELEYAANRMNESFYLGVYNGTHKPYERYFWSEENCFLARCDEVNDTACWYFPTTSDTLFHKIFLKANFTTEYVYPSFVSNRMKLIPTDKWTFNSSYDYSSIEMNASSGVHLLLATLKGRAYERDPPYVR